ncbi:F-box/kelch-repeat protein At3g06240-like [Argentina anserina]|uniref:F-box/kelch-repeat protein At3g06240-like n=1 Tax=Argentina anserina TaxID=57926 RepID=UPI0021768B20|nr:F-box/kelch-repeat protein At3g06240-like [Potentilla anserina]
MSDDLPEASLEKILLSLPTKSLMKCTAVCKSWLSLIKSSTFIHTHLNRSIQDNNSRLFLLYAHNYRDRISKSYSMLWPDPVFGDCKPKLNPITYNGGTIVYKGSHVSPQCLVVVGTCNGLVCLAPRPGDESPVVIWNPSIRSIVICPSKPHNEDPKYAFGYDSRTNDHKVLKIMRAVDVSNNKIEIRGDNYSLATGMWKRVLLLFLDNFIMSFDMVSEVFCKMNVPEALGEQECRCTKYGDCLSMVATADRSFEFNIWVMKEYGVAESWTKITLRHERNLRTRELMCCRSEQLVFGIYGPNMYAVDCRTGQGLDKSFISKKKMGGLKP